MSMLSIDRHKQTVRDALAAVGAPVTEFRVELLKDKAAEQREAQSEKSMQTLFDPFGRDAVQVSDR